MKPEVEMGSPQTSTTATQISEPHLPEADRRFEVACSCVGRCSVLFCAEWDESDGVPASSSFDFYTRYKEDRWGARFRAAWASLRGKDVYYHGIVVEPEQARDLGRWLLRKARR